MLKHRSQFLWGCLAVIMALIALAPSCYEPTVGNETPLESPNATTAPSVYDIDITQYKLVVYGLVQTPLTLTYESIMTYPTVTHSATLLCYTDFLSYREWTGVPVSTLLTEAGIQPGAESVVFHAVDGYSVALALSDVSLASVMSDDVFLAYEVDGQKLAKEDGYPLRLVAVGHNGSDWVRWVSGIEVK